VACGGGGSGVDGGNGSDGGTTPDGVSATQFGSVFIQSYVAGPAVGGSASAVFYSSTGPCTRMVLGECELDSCTDAPQTAVSAGMVTITGATKPIALTPAANHTYTPLSSTTALFGNGDPLTFAAAGADVPAFSHALVAPSKVTITAPVKPATTLTVDRASDLAVSWTGGGTGQVLVALLSGAQTGTSVYCRFAASAGHGMVPAQTLQHLQGGSGAFAMAAIDDAEVDAGMWAVHLEAYFNAVWPDDTIVSGPTTVQ